MPYDYQHQNQASPRRGDPWNPQSHQESRGWSYRGHEREYTHAKVTPWIDHAEPPSPLRQPTPAHSPGTVTHSSRNTNESSSLSWMIDNLQSEKKKRKDAEVKLQEAETRLQKKGDAIKDQDGTLAQIMAEFERLELQKDPATLPAKHPHRVHYNEEMEKKAKEAEICRKMIEDSMLIKEYIKGWSDHLEEKEKRYGRENSSSRAATELLLTIREVRMQMQDALRYEYFDTWEFANGVDRHRP